MSSVILLPLAVPLAYVPCSERIKIRTPEGRGRFDLKLILLGGGRAAFLMSFLARQVRFPNTTVYVGTVVVWLLIDLT